MTVLHVSYGLRGGGLTEVTEPNELTAILADVAANEGTDNDGVLAVDLDTDQHGLSILTRNGEGALHFASRGAREVFMSLGDKDREGTDHFKSLANPMSPNSKAINWTEHPLNALIQWEKVVEAALEFMRTGERPTSIEWQPDPLRG